MFYLPEKDSNLYKATDQYLWGDNVMVVPVTEKGAKQLNYYIPKGTWTNINNYQMIQGPQWIMDTTIKMQSIPVYAKEGSFIPMEAPMMHTDEYSKKKLMVYYFASTERTSYDLFEDDGTDAQSIQNKEYDLLHFEGKNQLDEINIRINCSGGKINKKEEKRNMEIRVPNVLTERIIYVDGKKSNQSTFDESIHGYVIPVSFEHKPITITLKRK